METTISKQTQTTPNVIYDDYKNEILIKGNSIPFESDIFWTSIIDEIKKIQDKNKLSKIKIDLHYINTNSIIYLYQLFNIKNETLIEWFFEDGDDDMHELGEYLSFLCKKNFIFLNSELC